MPKHYLNKNVYESSIERIKYTLDNFEKGIHVTVNQYHNPNWMNELFIESNYIGIDKIGGFIINNTSIIICCFFYFS